MMEILKPYFDAEEVIQLQELPDYAETKEKIEQMQADKMLDSLASRIGENIKTAKTLEEKWEIFKFSLESNDETPETGDEESVEGGIDFSKLSKEKIQKMADDGIKEAQEFLESQVENGLNTVVSGFKKTVEKSWLGKILPKEFIDWIAQTGKEKAEGKLEGIGGAIKGWIVGFIVGFIPGGKLLMKGYEKYFGEEEGEGDGEGNGEEDQQETPEEGSDSPEEVAEGSDINLEIINAAGYESAGFRIISLQSGIEKEKNSETIGVYKDVKEKSILEITEIFRSTNKKESGTLKEALGVTGSIDDNELEKIILGLIGPFNRSFFRSSIGSQSAIKDLLFDKEGEPLETIDKVFSVEELEEMKKQNFNYENFSISAVSRLVSIYWKNMGAKGLHYMGELAQNTSNDAYKFLFGGELSQTINTLSGSTAESGVFPQKIALMFKDDAIGGKDLDMSTADLQKKSDMKFNDDEIEKIDEFIKFRDEEVKDFIANNFGLGMDNFKDTFLNALNYGNIGALYVMLDGKPISRLDSNRKLLIYAWIFSILGDKQGEYTAAIGDTLHNNSDRLSEDEANILLVMSYRIVEGQRNGTIKFVKNIYGAGHETIKNQLPEQVEDYADWIAWGIEGGGAIGLWKLLGWFPTTRAVLFVSAGVGIGGLYYFTGEVGYQNLDSKRQKVLDDFITEIFAGTDNIPSEEIRNDIQNGTIPFSEIFSKLSDIDIYTEFYGKS